MSRQTNSQDYDWLVKVIVIGDSGVGKTNILSQFCDAKFSISHMATLGVDFKIKTIEVDGKKLKLQIWDTAGQERFRNITKTYYKGAQGVILTYSVIDRQSFENVEGWLKSIQDNTNSSDVQLVLVGNKADMSAERQVTQQEGQKMSQQYNIPFYETSAKSNMNITEAFQNLSQRIIQTLIKMQVSEEKQGQSLKNDKKSDQETHKKKVHGKFIERTVVEIINDKIYKYCSFHVLLINMQDKSNTNSSVHSNRKQQPDSLEKQKRRRTRKDSDAQREFKCECGKSYLSYPALYTHTKQKHNGQSMKNLDEQRQESTISESQTQDIFTNLANILGKEEKDTLTFQQINTQDIYDLIMWEIQLLIIETNTKEIKMDYYDELLKQKCPLDINTPQEAFIKFIYEVKEVLNFEQMKLVFLFVYCFRKLLIDFPDTTTSGLVEKANLLVCSQLDKVIQSVQQLSSRNYIVHLSRISNLREAIIQIVLSFCNWLYARHLTDDKLLLKSDSD